MESFHQNYVVIFQTTILRIVGFYVRRSALELFSTDTYAFERKILINCDAYQEPINWKKFSEAVFEAI